MAPQLRYLSLQFCPVTTETLVDILRRCTCLTYLRVSGDSRMKTIDIPREVAIPTLVYLDVCGCGVSDAVMFAISRRCKKLQYLLVFRDNTLHRHRITNAGVRAVLKGCPLLREMDVEHATGISTELRLELTRRQHSRRGSLQATVTPLGKRVRHTEPHEAIVILEGSDDLARCVSSTNLAVVPHLGKPQPAMDYTEEEECALVWARVRCQPYFYLLNPMEDENGDDHYREPRRRFRVPASAELAIADNEAELLEDHAAQVDGSGALLTPGQQSAPAARPPVTTPYARTISALITYNLTSGRLLASRANDLSPSQSRVQPVSTSPFPVQPFASGKGRSPEYHGGPVRDLSASRALTEAFAQVEVESSVVPTALPRTMSIVSRPTAKAVTPVNARGIPIVPSGARSKASVEEDGVVCGLSAGSSSTDATESTDKTDSFDSRGSPDCTVSSEARVGRWVRSPTLVTTVASSAPSSALRGMVGKPGKPSKPGDGTPAPLAEWRRRVERARQRAASGTAVPPASH